jgi:hypothetical protein
MHRPTEFFEEQQLRHHVAADKGRLSVLDGHLRHQLYLACEECGSEVAFARLYRINESSVNWAMNGRYPVRGAVLMAVASWMLGVREPIDGRTRLNARAYLKSTRGVAL